MMYRVLVMQVKVLLVQFLIFDGHMVKRQTRLVGVQLPKGVGVQVPLWPPVTNLGTRKQSQQRSVYLHLFQIACGTQINFCGVLARDG